MVSAVLINGTSILEWRKDNSRALGMLELKGTFMISWGRFSKEKMRKLELDSFAYVLIQISVLLSFQGRDNDCMNHFPYCGGSKSRPSTSRWKASFLE